MVLESYDRAKLKRQAFIDASGGETEVEGKRKTFKPGWLSSSESSSTPTPPEGKTFLDIIFSFLILIVC